MPPPSSEPISRQAVEALACPMAFALVGVAPATPPSHAEYFQRWLTDGRHGEMDYLARHVDQRLDPARLLPGARSIICVADRYPHTAATTQTPAPNADTSSDTRAKTPPRGRFARYAWGDDYHKVLKKRLHALADALRERWPGHEHKVCVDTAPLPEREHAAHAGLGWIGKHTLLIHPQLGSWLLLGAIVTTLDIRPETTTPVTDHCGACTRCIDACPTDCITPYQLDATRCISYLTLEHRGPIAPDLQPLMDDWLGGCDICQEVCPFNGAVRPDRLPADPTPHPRYAPRLTSLEFADVLDWTEDNRRAAFRGSALKRMKLDMVRRNAVIAAGNHLAQHADEPLRAKLERIAADPDEPALVRDTAQQVIARLARIPTP